MQGNTFTLARTLVVSIATLGLASCGGGGGGSDSPSTSTTVTAPALADTTGGSCSNSAQLGFVRNHVDNDYLFYKGAPTTSAASYSGTPDNFFYDLTTRAQPTKDRFSFVITAAQAQAVFQSGAGTGVGVDTRRDTQARLRVALVQPGSPAALAGLKRGDRITSINGTAVASAMTAAQSNALYYAAIGDSVTLSVQHLPDTSEQIINLKAAAFTVDPVPVVTTLASNGSTVGYIAFHEHTAPSETKLADAFKKLSQAGVSDLVLDMRYNGGGYLAIASQVAYMIAGSATKITGMTSYTKVFDRLEFNDKRAAENYNFGFLDYIALSTSRMNEALPTLNLKKVYVLTTASTCSASEAVVNGLRGIDIPVITIGGTSCGKPYGMYQTDNCSSSYFAIAFQGYKTIAAAAISRLPSRATTPNTTAITPPACYRPAARQTILTTPGATLPKACSPQPLPTATQVVARARPQASLPQRRAQRSCRYKTTRLLTPGAPAS